MSKSAEVAYNAEVLTVLLWEMLPSQRPDSERKLKRRLREKRLGKYDQTRIDALRRLRDSTVRELHLRDESSFHRKNSGKYSKLEDWDIERLAQHLIDEHADILEENIRAMLPQAIYAYYLR